MSFPREGSLPQDGSVSSCLSLQPGPCPTDVRLDRPRNPISRFLKINPIYPPTHSPTYLPLCPSILPFILPSVLLSSIYHPSSVHYPSFHPPSILLALFLWRTQTDTTSKAITSLGFQAPRPQTSSQFGPQQLPASPGSGNGPSSHRTVLPDKNASGASLPAPSCLSSTRSCLQILLFMPSSSERPWPEPSLTWTVTAVSSCSSCSWPPLSPFPPSQGHLLNPSKRDPGAPLLEPSRAASRCSHCSILSTPSVTSQPYVAALHLLASQSPSSLLRSQSPFRPLNSASLLLPRPFHICLPAWNL